MRQAAPCARPRPVPAVCGQDQQGEPRLCRAAEGRGQTAARSRQGPGVPAQALSQADRGAPRGRHLHSLRQGAGRTRAQSLRSMRRKAPRPRARALPEGGRGLCPLRRPQSRHPAPCRAHVEQQAPACAPGGRPVRALRQPASGRGRHDLRALQGATPSLREAALRPTQAGRLVYPLCRAHRRRWIAVRAMRGARGRARSAPAQECRQPAPLLGPARRRALYGLQPSQPGGGEMHALCREIA